MPVEKTRAAAAEHGFDLDAALAAEGIRALHPARPCPPSRPPRGTWPDASRPATAAYLAAVAFASAGFVSYGSKGGVRAVEHLRGIASELQLAHVRNQVMFSIFTDVENFETFKPTEQAASALTPMLDQLLLWTRAMEFARSEALVGTN